ncbi:hypothetical protein GCM10025869_12600 [Homoserinibacter gongjuensis]|uniref:Uncharacterized protein n=1 Tax=Homoserinibacter gongjuensis TaxID=1162968 RepID=A0ABQ6JR04_9MICO|nr:bile acid:sodium symporter [Homoserinibacter gongjuensis]GMA90731.1 hypothetical protein GCM10025869_12600 [Homoserinibacter gongjuensis]
MGSALTSIGLPVALGIIMFGLGLSLRPADFARVAKHPKAVVIALVCQLVLLPALCLGLVVLFQLPPVLAVGMMLLAASPVAPPPTSTATCSGATWRSTSRSPPSTR